MTDSAMNTAALPPRAPSDLRGRAIPVTVHLFDGGSVHGDLETLDPDRGTVRLFHKTPEKTLEVPLDQIRYMIFTRPLSDGGRPYPVMSCLADTPLPETAQPFQISFQDDIAVSGETRGSFTDEVGLHLFKPVHGQSVTQMFVPLTGVKDYRLGTATGRAATHGRRLRDAPPSGHDLYRVVNTAENSRQLRQLLNDRDRYTAAQGAHAETPTLGRILVDYNQISPQALEDALQCQIASRDKKVGTLLKERGTIGNDQLYTALARQLNLPFVDLGGFDIDPKALTHVPQTIARRFCLLPLCLYGDALVIVMNDPTDTEAVDTVRFVSGRRVEIAKASQAAIETAITESYGDEDNLDEDITAVAPPEPDEQTSLREAERLGQERPIVRLVNRIIVDAIRRRASDIHIRPLTDSVDLLFRIDGMLIRIRSFNKHLLPAVVSRIKILGRMDIAERRMPQDGRSRVVDRDTVVDLRISVIPTVDGESVVIRLLNTAAGLKPLSDLGFNDHDLALVQDMLQKSYGMLLVTGPTGSGKSTTLYAALQSLITRNLNIITVEDPVEYHISGIEQIQVNAAPGYGFARALRHILRHDPDVIMIGEIRDQETCKIAIESALTGHLVLSTLHTNNATGAVTRLVEMGIEPFLLNATVLGVLAQRLVRRNCPHCVQEETPDPGVRRALGVTDGEIFYKGAGCEYCNATGYSGRVAVYELLTLTPKLRTMIQEGVPGESLGRQAVAEGMMPLTQNALSLARRRETSLAEVYRVRLF